MSPLVSREVYKTPQCRIPLSLNPSTAFCPSPSAVHVSWLQNLRGCCKSQAFRKPRHRGELVEAASRSDILSLIRQAVLCRFQVPVDSRALQRRLREGCLRRAAAVRCPGPHRFCASEPLNVPKVPNVPNVRGALGMWDLWDLDGCICDESSRWFDLCSSDRGPLTESREEGKGLGAGLVPVLSVLCRPVLCL